MARTAVGAIFGRRISHAGAAQVSAARPHLGDCLSDSDRRHRGMTCGERWMAHWSDAESDEVIGTEAAGGATPPKFLLIEADEGLTRMLRVSLAASGLDVTQATCGDEALRALEQGPTDAVILDLGAGQPGRGRATSAAPTGAGRRTHLGGYIGAGLPRDNTAVRPGRGPLPGHALRSLGPGRDAGAAVAGKGASSRGRKRQGAH